MKIVAILFALAPFALAACATGGNQGTMSSMLGAPTPQSSGSVTCLPGQVAHGDHCVSTQPARY